MRNPFVQRPGLGLAIVLSIAAAFSAQHARAADEQPPIVATPLAPGEVLPLDASLSHPAWQRAPVYSRFIEKDPHNGAVPSHDTLVQVLFDQRHLYIGVRALDPQPQLIRERVVRHDNVNRTQDFVVVYVDAIGSKRSAQFFRVGSAGSTADGMHTAADDNEDFAPDYDFDAVAQRNADGWSAMLRIPFASLRFGNNLGQGWRIMVARRIPRDQFHLVATVPIPDEAPHFIVNLQPLLGVELPEQQQFLSVRPSITLRRERASLDGAPQPTGHVLDASIDLKWRPLPQLVVDATVNPDFSQLELDVPQLRGNTRYALYFPEKRPFFFESSDLLRSPTDAMYTRSLTEPRWGLRGTWRGPQLAGTAFAVNDRGGGSVLLPGPYATGFATQGASQALAARVRGDRQGLQWGALMAARRYADGAGDNVVLGPDAFWQIDDAWRARGQWLAAETSAWPDANGDLVRSATRRGQRLHVKATRQVDLAQFDIGYDDIGEDFRNDSGFVNQVGVRHVDVHQGIGWRRVGPLNQLWFNLNAGRSDDRATGERVQEAVTPGLWMSGAHNLELTIEYHGLSRLRTASAAPLLSERYWKADLVVTPLPWIPFVEAGVALGRLADVVANEVRPGGKSSLTVRSRPLVALELEPSVSAAWLKRAGERTYQESAARLLAIWHFNARHNLRAIVQRTTLERAAEPGVLSQRDASRATSLTYSWRRSAGTLLYAGASRARSGVASVARGSELFVKLQFDLDDMRSGW